MKDFTPNTEVNAKLWINRGYKVEGLVFMKNGCCPELPVVITRAGKIYSTQCACGGWCSNGHRTATAAVLEYARMSAGHGIWDHSKVAGTLGELERVVIRLSEA